MLKILGPADNSDSFCDGLSRRNFLQIGGLGSGLSLAGLLAAEAAQPMDDLHGAADYKEHLVRVFLERVFAEAVGAAPVAQRSAA